MDWTTVRWNHAYLHIQDLRFHLVIEGEGPTVLLLHGFPENWFSWRYQIKALAEAGYQAVAMDLRGYNESDRPLKRSAYHIDHLCGDVLGIIEALGKRQVHLVGHDWGGVLAWIFASRHPERISSLSILNAPHPGIFIRHLPTSIRQLRRSWYMFFFQLPWLAEYIFRRDSLGFFQRIFRGQARRKEMFSDDVIALFAAAMMKPNAFWAGIQYYRAGVSISTIKEFIRFPKITTPTMVIWGDRDVALGIELCDDLEKQMSGPYRFHRIQGCSHWVQQEEPEAVNRFLLDFLLESW